jgi:thiamine biosynthesis protein ThiS
MVPTQGIIHRGRTPLPIRIFLDGEPIDLDVPVTLDRLLRDRGHSPEILSVMLNGRVIPRSSYTTTRIREGDELMAVVQVGGG